MRFWFGLHDNDVRNFDTKSEPGRSASKIHFTVYKNKECNPQLSMECSEKNAFVRKHSAVQLVEISLRVKQLMQLFIDQTSTVCLNLQILNVVF